MTSSLHSLVTSAPSGRSRPVLLDHGDYATAVIRQGAAVPWADLAALPGHFGQVHALVDPDATWVDVGALYDAHLAADPTLVEAMGARSRTGYALRTLLGDDAGVERTTRTASTLSDATRRPLVLALPSPARWLTRAHATGEGPLDSVDEHGADSASMYLAEWIGRLGALPVALVLLDARPRDTDGKVEVDETLAAYTAIANVAAHFEWSLALRHEAGIEVPAGEPVIGLVPEEFWLDATPAPDGEVLLGTIPSAAEPERVLERLALLR